MTDNEIIKALEYCCGSIQNDCRDCPFGERCEDDESLLKYSLDLINRMDAEIERKTTECERLEIYMDELVKQRLNQAKSEAYREFADKLHDNFISKVQRRYCRINGEHSYKYTEGYTADVLSAIVNTLKELTEEKRNVEH